MEGENSRSNLVLPLFFDKYRTTQGVAALLAITALSTGIVSGRGYADELTESDEPVVSVTSETAIPNGSEEHSDVDDNQVVVNSDDSEKVESKLDSTASEKTLGDDNNPSTSQTLSEDTIETTNSQKLVNESSSQDTRKTITDEEVRQFDLWTAVGFERAAANDPTKIALANFPISSTRSDIPLVISPNVKSTILEFSGANYYSETEGVLTEKDARYDLLVTYDDVTDTWWGQPYFSNSQIRSSAFVVKSTQNENGSITLYVPVTKEQISVFEKGLYTVTAIHSKDLHVTASDWIINTEPTIDISKKTVVAEVDEVVDLLSTVTITDKEDDFSNNDSYTTRIETLSYENLSTGKITVLKSGTTTVKISDPGDYRVRISVKDSDGQSVQKDYTLTVSSPSPAHPEIVPDSPEPESPVDSAPEEDVSSPQLPAATPEDSSDGDDKLVDSDSNTKPESHPETVPDSPEPESPVDSTPEEDVSSPQPPADTSEVSSDSDNELVASDSNTKPESHPETVPDSPEPESPVDSTPEEDVSSPQPPVATPDDTSDSDNELVASDSNTKPESHPDIVPDSPESEVPVDSTSEEDAPSLQPPVATPDDSSDSDNELVDSDSNTKPESHPETDPDSPEPESPVDSTPEEDDSSPQLPADTSEVSSDSDNESVKPESHPDIVPDSPEPEVPVDSTPEEAAPSPQPPVATSEVLSDSDEEVLGNDSLLSNIMPDGAHGATSNSNEPLTDDSPEKAVDAINDTPLAKSSPKTIATKLPNSKGNDNHTRSRLTNVTTVPVTFTLNNLEVSVKIAQNVLEYFSASTYFSEQRNHTPSDQNEFEQSNNEKSQKSTAAKKVISKDYNDVNLFDETTNNFSSVEKKVDLKSLLVHLLIFTMIIAYSLVGFHFLKRDH
ncbi:hypothetical protein [Streptococcus thoraltensis]|uniref:hypothetical protein n=1 Tax=Streptococcus thoraltensis TaxID=55085 RepID=UPI001F586CE1|nr:hypothetical protein [Streptococcus thoraltensis]